jgi:hypothetical protein
MGNCQGCRKIRIRCITNEHVILEGGVSKILLRNNITYIGQNYVIYSDEVFYLSLEDTERLYATLNLRI